MSGINNYLGDLGSLDDREIAGVADLVIEERVRVVHGRELEIFTPEDGVDVDQLTKDACRAVTQELNDRMGI